MPSALNSYVTTWPAQQGRGTASATKNVYALDATAKPEVAGHGRQVAGEDSGLPEEFTLYGGHTGTSKYLRLPDETQ